MAEMEDEQLEALKRWWQEYGRALLLGVGQGGLIAAGGWWWFAHQAQQADAASGAYQVLMRELEQDRHAQVIDKGQQLIADYSRTAYAGLAALAVARAAVATGDTEVASAQLRWATDNADSDELRQLARLHLGRVLLDAGRHDEALAALADTPPAMRAVFEEARGDVYLAAGERAQAREAYGAALAAAGERASKLLRMKYDDLADAAAEETARS